MGLARSPFPYSSSGGPFPVPGAYSTAGERAPERSAGPGAARRRAGAAVGGGGRRRSGLFTAAGQRPDSPPPKNWRAARRRPGAAGEAGRQVRARGRGERKACSPSPLPAILLLLGSWRGRLDVAGPISGRSAAHCERERRAVMAAQRPGLCLAGPQLEASGAAAGPCTAGGGGGGYQGRCAIGEGSRTASRVK